MCGLIGGKYRVRLIRGPSVDQCISNFLSNRILHSSVLAKSHSLNVLARYNNPIPFEVRARGEIRQLSLASFCSHFGLFVCRGKPRSSKNKRND